MSEFSHDLPSYPATNKHVNANLLPQVYDELRKLAGVLLAKEAAGNTLDATALVHEAYVPTFGLQQSVPLG